jgi:hypothetical protein
MKTINLFFLLALAFLSCASLHAQVTIGGVTSPKAGAILDLNSTDKGGLLLSNVNITSLDSIPARDGHFPGVTTLADMDINWGLRGALVYNTNPTTGIGIHVWNGKYWWPIAKSDHEQILFTISISDGENTFFIPTSGFVGGTFDHDYDWDISIDGQAAVNYTGRGEDGSGIWLSGLASSKHQIRITPHTAPVPGWGNAFGGGENYDRDNQSKLISIDAPLTTLAFAPKTTEPDADTNASYMFAYLFLGCENLTAPLVIEDTYRLPATITDLSNFLYYTHALNTALTKPVNLAPLSGWFNGNNSINNLANFLATTYSGNTALIEPVNLAPLSGWFKENTSINNLSYFLGGTHGFNALIKPVNLAPLSGWFNGNNSIDNLAYFLGGIHFGNTALKEPVNLVPLSGWFEEDTSIDDLEGFLYGIHYDNPSLKLEGQKIFPDWIRTLKLGPTSTPISDVPVSFSLSFSLVSPQDGDTGEPAFGDGTPLSVGVGDLNSNRYTYTGRNGISPTKSNWK